MRQKLTKKLNIYLFIFTFYYCHCYCYLYVCPKLIWYVISKSLNRQIQDVTTPVTFITRRLCIVLKAVPRYTIKFEKIMIILTL